jgi:tRNA pseudouridine38-40 synthase
MIHHTSIKQRGDLVILSIQGDGFMTHMVRMLVGTVLAHVQGKLTLEDIKHLLKTNKHLPVSYKAEPHGLCLESVKYVKTS